MAVTATVVGPIVPTDAVAVKAALETLGVASAAVIVIPVAPGAVMFAKTV